MCEAQSSYNLKVIRLNIAVEFCHVLAWVVKLTVMALIHEMPSQAKKAAH